MSVTPPYYDPISNLNLADTFYTWYRRTNDIVQKLNPLELYGLSASTQPGYDGLTIDINTATGIAQLGYALPYTIGNDHVFTGGLTFAGDIVAISGTSFMGGNVQFEPNDTNGFVTFNSGVVQFETGVNKVDFFTDINIDDSDIKVTDSDIDIIRTPVEIDLAGNVGAHKVLITSLGGQITTLPIFGCKVPTAFYHAVQFEERPNGEGSSPITFSKDTTIDAASPTVNFHAQTTSERQFKISGNNVTFSGSEASWEFQNEKGVKFNPLSAISIESGATFEEDSKLVLKGMVYDSDGSMPGAGHVLITDAAGRLNYGDKQFIWNTNKPGLGTAHFAMNYMLGNMSHVARAATGLPFAVPRYYVFSRRTLLPEDWASSQFHGASHGGITFHKGIYSIIRAHGASGDDNIEPIASYENERYRGFGGTMSPTFAKILACGGYKTFGTPFPEMGITFCGLTGCTDNRMKNKYWYADVNIYEGHPDPTLEDLDSTVGGEHYTWKRDTVPKTYWSSNMRANPNDYQENSSTGWLGVTAGTYLQQGIPVVPDGLRQLATWAEMSSSMNLGSGHRNTNYTSHSPELFYEDPVDLIGSEQIGQFGGVIPDIELPISHSPYMFNVKLRYNVPAGMRLIIAFQIDPTFTKNFPKNQFDNYPFHRDDSAVGETKSPDWDEDDISDDGEFRQQIFTPSTKVSSESFGGDDSHEIRRFLRIKSSDFAKKVWQFAFKYVTSPYVENDEVTGVSTGVSWSQRQDWLATETNGGHAVSVWAYTGSNGTFTKSDFEPNALYPIPYLTDPPGENPTSQITAKKGMSIVAEGLQYGGALLAKDFPMNDGGGEDQTFLNLWNSSAERIAPIGGKDTRALGMTYWNRAMAQLASTTSFDFGLYGVTGCGRDENGKLYGADETQHEDEANWTDLRAGINTSRLYHDGPYSGPRPESEYASSVTNIGPDMGYYDRVIRYQLRNTKRSATDGNLSDTSLLFDELETTLRLHNVRDKNAMGHNHEVVFGRGHFANVTWDRHKLRRDAKGNHNGAEPRLTTSFINPLTGGGTATGIYQKDANDNDVEIIPWERVSWWSDNQPTTPFSFPNSKAAFDYFGELPSVTGDIYGTHEMGGVGSATGKRKNVELRAFFNDSNSSMFSPFRPKSGGEGWTRWTSNGSPVSKASGYGEVPTYERTTTWGSGYVYFTDDRRDQFIDQFDTATATNTVNYATEFILTDHYGNQYTVDNFHRGTIDSVNERNETRGRYSEVDLDFTDIEPDEVTYTGDDDGTRLLVRQPQEGEILLQIPSPLGGILTNSGECPHPLYLKSKIIAMDINDGWKRTPKQIWDSTLTKNSSIIQASSVAVHEIDDTFVPGGELADCETRLGNTVVDTSGNGITVDDHKIYAADGEYVIRFLGTNITIQR